MDPYDHDVFTAKARILHAMGAGGGAASLTSNSLREVSPGVLEEALLRLEKRGLAAVRDDRVEVGDRGSLLSPELVRKSNGAETFGGRIDHVPVVESTNDHALDLVGAGADPGTVVIAEYQSAGRGRRGRSFSSLPGLGVWSSTLLPAPRNLDTAPRLSLVCALGVARAVEELTDRVPAVKWPNDVYLEGRKICGILVEARVQGNRSTPIAGIGLNVHQTNEDFPDEIRDAAGSLESISGRRIERAAALAKVLEHLEDLVRLEIAGELKLTESFAPVDGMDGRDVVITEEGGQTRGKAKGIHEDGSLVVEVASGKTRIVRSADATLRSEED